MAVKLHYLLNKPTRTVDIICLGCGNKFTKLNNNIKKYCSETCKMYAHRKRSLERARAKGSNADPSKQIVKNCAYCNKEFKTSLHVKKFCSEKCSSKSTNNKIINGYYNRLNSSFLKLRFELFKRDDFKCQYCGRSPSIDGCKLNIDHILPKSKGGTNEPKNLITSCFECNQGKKDILLESREIGDENE